jgi:beta-lactamase family protein
VSAHLQAALEARGAAGAVARIEAPRAGLTWDGAGGYLARGDSRALRPDDAFRAASVTKSVTAAVAVGLAHQGRRRMYLTSYLVVPASSTEPSRSRPARRRDRRRSRGRPGVRARQPHLRDGHPGEHAAAPAGTRLRGAHHDRPGSHPDRSGSHGRRSAASGTDPDHRRHGRYLRRGDDRHVLQPGAAGDGHPPRAGLRTHKDTGGSPGCRDDVGFT